MFSEIEYKTKAELEKMEKEELINFFLKLVQKSQKAEIISPSSVHDQK